MRGYINANISMHFTIHISYLITQLIHLHHAALEPTQHLGEPLVVGHEHGPVQHPVHQHHRHFFLILISG